MNGAKGNPADLEAVQPESADVRDLVDVALRHVDAWKPAQPNHGYQPNLAEVLAAEVRRLRESELLRHAALETMNTIAESNANDLQEALAKLARVEALIVLEHDDSTVRVSRIRAALRGEP